MQTKNRRWGICPLLQEQVCLLISSYQYQHCVSLLLWNPIVWMVHSKCIPVLRFTVWQITAYLWTDKSHCNGQHICHRLPTFPSKLVCRPSSNSSWHSLLIYIVFYTINLHHLWCELIYLGCALSSLNNGRFVLQICSDPSLCRESCPRVRIMRLVDIAAFMLW